MANLRANKITSTEVFETTGSVQFDGSGDVLTVPNSADFRLGNGDFTIECWFYYKGALSSNRTLFGLFENSSARRSYQVEVRSNGVIRFEWWPDGSTGNSIDTAASTVSISTWHHYAATRTNGIITQYLNGESLVSRSVGTSSFYDNTDDPFRIGALNANVDQSFPGHITNLRVIKGTALYTTNFKPSMRELEVVPGTVLLACQSKTDASLEKTGKTITVNGNAVANELTPGLLTDVVKSGGSSAITGSVEFDGSGSTAGGYLEVTPDDDLQFLHKCTDSYTVEAWVHKQASTQGTIFDSGGTSSTTIGIVLFGDSGGVLQFRARQALSASPTSITTGNVMANDMWHHVALTYDKSTVRLFVNGILVGSTSYSTESSVDSTQSFKIGAYEYSGTTKDGHFNGFISNFRVVKGTALYTDNFIPPTRTQKSSRYCSLMLPGF